MTVPCRFLVNGSTAHGSFPPMRRLLDVLRDECGLTATKEGCGEGECGSCSVLLDGVLVNSCLVPVAEVNGREVTTLEGLPADDPLFAAFAATGGTQCGICTPGMIMAARALLNDHPCPDLAKIREALAGNLCRCTGYGGIYAAIRAASGQGE
ncbi:(2Fe-2S)-binding protein [Acidiferrobacter thiooxydans]|uniref:(2Fe-2S)-binding protein n=1 Tax=Acidiferrobacter thiooxydans TaxID=163359 RepID=UPI000DF2BA06|nr:(2Fe-2S)-binding protein [Acidiferrobacter thiooxydans]